VLSDLPLKGEGRVGREGRAGEGGRGGQGGRRGTKGRTRRDMRVNPPPRGKILSLPLRCILSILPLTAEP